MLKLVRGYMAHGRRQLESGNRRITATWAPELAAERYV